MDIYLINLAAAGEGARLPIIDEAASVVEYPARQQFPNSNGCGGVSMMTKRNDERLIMFPLQLLIYSATGEDQ
ncbi:hypothetical protein [Nocardia sp. NPDC003726]